MRRVLRIFANVAAGISLLLCVAVVCLWVRSYWATDAWGRFGYFIPTHEYRQEIVYVNRGTVALTLWSYKIDDRSVRQFEVRAAKGSFLHRWGPMKYALPWPAPQGWERVLVVRVFKNVRNGGAPGVGNGVNVFVSYWVLFLLTAIGPGLWMWGWWRRRRWRQGFCRECGYDLRASPDRCPECGAVAVGSEEVRA